MTERDQAYYLRRAEAELALAACAAHPAAMRAHYHLAGFYLDKTYGARGEGQAGTGTLAAGIAHPSDHPVQAA